MPKKIRRMKRVLIFWQFLILLAAIFCTIFFISINYIKQFSELWKNNLNQIALFATHQLRIKDATPPGNIGNYVIFVINQKDGSYVFQRKARSEEDQRLWKSYHSMLIYQMQKQRQGWITYPQKNSGKIFQKRRMIRYLPVKERGWVVGVDAVMESDWDIIQGAVNLEICIRILFIIFISLYLLGFLVYRNFSIMKKIIADSLESNFMNLSNEDVWGAGNAEKRIAEKVEYNASIEEEAIPNDMESLRDDFGGDPLTQQEKSEETVMMSRSEFEAPLVKKVKPLKLDSIEKDSMAENFEKEKNFDKLIFEEKQKSVNKKVESVEVKKEIPKIDSGEEKASFDDLKINVQGIKSPILKKMIKELREKD